jgi:hypothetical protein
MYRNWSRMIGRRMAAVAAALALSIAPRAGVGQELNYSYTTFLNGFASSNVIWNTNYPSLGNRTTPAYLSRTINLRTVVTPTLSALYLPDSAAGQPSMTATLRTTLTTNTTGSHVLIGHSLGAMVARHEYLVDPANRGRIAAIISLGSPHQGLPLSDSSARAGAFLLDAQRRINNATSATGLLFYDIALFLTGFNCTTGVGCALLDEGVATGVLAIWTNNAHPIDVSGVVTLLYVAALPSVKTQSSFITGLNASTVDAAIPRANLKGIVPHRNAILRLYADIKHRDLGEVVKDRNRGLSLFKACHVVGYAMVVTSGLARKCGWAKRVMKRMDERWSLYTIGRRDPNAGFDGVVPNERSHYPGLTDPLLDFAPAPLTTHVELYVNKASVDALATAMARINMPPSDSLNNPPPPPPPAPPPLSVTVAGPTSVRPGATCAWLPSPNGGSAPYSYSWNGLGAPGEDPQWLVTAPSSGSFTLTVTVTDAALNVAAGTRTVTVTSQAPICVQ